MGEAYIDLIFMYTTEWKCIKIYLKKNQKQLWKGTDKNYEQVGGKTEKNQ